MTSRQLLETGVAMLADRPDMATAQNVANLRIAAALRWQQEEMGGIEHVQFALRNNTPIVPSGHECHPLELVKRGYVDGQGWPKATANRKIRISRWEGGWHWYASVEGEEVIEDGRVKWDTYDQAEQAARRFSKKRPAPHRTGLNVNVQTTEGAT